MPSVVRRRPLNACGGIAVDTATRARLVHANVLALDTAALLSLTAVFLEIQLQTEKFRDQLVIHALAGIDAGQVEFVGAALDFHAIPGGRFRQRRHEAGQVTWFQKGNAPFFKLPDTPLDLPVEVSHADYGAPRVTFQGAGDTLEGFPMEIQVSEAGEENGIIAPDDFSRANTLRKSLKSSDCRLNGGYPGINLSGVSHECV